MLYFTLLEDLHVLVAVADSGSLALPVLLRFFVSDERFAVLSIALRFVLGDPDYREYTVALSEDTIHFFQGAVSGFGIEEPDHGEHGSITAARISDIVNHPISESLT